MKKLLLLFGCFISVLSTAQEIDKPYDFPVKPGTEQWAKLTTSKQMDEVCVIPDEVLSAMSTKALLITCLNYPRIIDFFLIDNMQYGFDFYSRHFNGLAELVKKPDLNKILLQSYIDIDLIKSRMAGYDAELSYLQTVFFELLISQENIIKGYERKDKLILLSEAIKKLEQRRKLGESVYRQITSALILIRILYSEDIILSEVDDNGNDIYKIFRTTGFLPDSTIIDRLLIKSEGIVSF
ncbi:MAG: hypothetical protein JXR90_00695 [Spirochaetes bacterium]|nr:hypothetical protein [Spirochaetota bacterium]